MVENGLHLLDSELFALNIILDNMEGDSAGIILLALSSVLQFQYTTANQVDIGDGRTVRIEDTILPLFASTIEVAFESRTQNEYRRYYKELVKQLRQHNPNSQEDDDELIIIFNNKFL
jgi:hypothetical protein